MLSLTRSLLCISRARTRVRKLLGPTSGIKSSGVLLILLVQLVFTVSICLRWASVRVILDYHCAGNFGQANYSAAKMGLISFTMSLAREGTKYNISSVAIAPVAASAMTATIMSPEMLENLKVCKIVGYHSFIS